MRMDVPRSQAMLLSRTPSRSWRSIPSAPLYSLTGLNKSEPRHFLQGEKEKPPKEFDVRHH